MITKVHKATKTAIRTEATENKQTTTTTKKEKRKNNHGDNKAKYHKHPRQQ